MIAEFYDDCEVFITGGSGAVGKALIDKLLRSCNVRRVYVLLRPKRNFDVEQRLEKLKQAKIFKVLRDTKEHMLDRLVAIPGDAILPNLGISGEYLTLLANVSIMFHCAATVRFDEPIRMALMLNVGGTHEALKFAEKLEKLKIFMHVSTFYSNPYLKHVEPKIYESPMDWRKCLALAQDPQHYEALNSLARKIIIGFPNTYTFTKNLAESVVNDFRERLPVAIYRPSIVLHALGDPVPGFPPTMMGAMGLFVLVGTGIIKSVYMSAKTRFDITPQDVAIKTMLYYTCRAEKEFREKKQALVSAPVYMSSSTQHSPHTFLQMCLVMENGLWYKAAFEKNFMIPGCHYTDSRFVYKFLVFFKQILPALLADCLIRLSGREPVLMTIVRKAYNTLEVMQPFLFNTYSSPGMTHLDDLIENTNGTEFELLPYITEAATDEGLVNICTRMVFKIREILLNEDPKTIPQSQRLLRIKALVYNVIRAILAYYILRWFYSVLCNYLNTKIA